MFVGNYKIPSADYKPLIVAVRSLEMKVLWELYVHTRMMQEVRYNCAMIIIC